MLPCSRGPAVNPRRSRDPPCEARLLSSCFRSGLFPAFASQRVPTPAVAGPRQVIGLCGATAFPVALAVWGVFHTVNTPAPWGGNK